MDDWLNQDSLARFVGEVIDDLDLSNRIRQYAGRGSKAHHPATLLAILVDGYTTGIFSSRKLERATHDSVACRFIAAGSHPDHDRLATFRCRFLDELSDPFVQILETAKEMKRLKLGNVGLDGIGIDAHAARHRALSDKHIEKREGQFKAEVQELPALAEEADQADLPDGVRLPEELKRRDDRLAALAVAKARIAARAAERYPREKAEYDEKRARHAAREEATGKKSGGKPPRVPEPGARDSDQINLTDEESRLVSVADGGFEQAYDAQAGVDAATLLVVAVGVTQAANDKEQIEPMLATLKAQAGVLGAVACLIADTGLGSEKNIQACAAAGIEPLIAVARDEHHAGWRERHSEPPPLPDDATAVHTLSHRLKAQAGRVRYALRKQTIEPVFGIIKSVMRFRHFSVRGLKKVTGEWTLVSLAWNLKRLAALRPQ